MDGLRYQIEQSVAIKSIARDINKIANLMSSKVILTYEEKEFLLDILDHTMTINPLVLVVKEKIKNL